MNKKAVITAKVLMYQKAVEKVKKKGTGTLNTELYKEDLKRNMKNPKFKKSFNSFQ